MANEFVKLSPHESVYTQKNLLYSELETLTATKHLLNYKFLKSDENKLKISLKSKISECLNLINSLDKTLPKVKMHEPENSPDIEEKEMLKQEEISNSFDTAKLELELEKIKRKLSALQS